MAAVTADELARPWFERYPDLLDWELRRFSDLGLACQLDEQLKDSGRIEIKSEVAYDGQTTPITVNYPAEYPELPPTIFGPAGLLDRHQHRFGGSFCLLPRPLDDWPARDWGAADLIHDRLRALLADSEAGPEQVRKAEAPMPEPFSAYFDYAVDAAVQFPAEAMPPADRRSGRLWLRRPAPQLFVVERSETGASPESFLTHFPKTQAIEARWKRLDAPPDRGSRPQDVLDWVREEAPDLLSRRPPPPPPNRRRKNHPRQPPLELCALVFPEEGPGVGEVRDAWLFLLLDRSGGAEQPSLLHCETVSRAERSRRLVELEGLEERRVLVIGLGTIGAPIAIELSRAGVGTLDLVDCERFEFGNTPRHPLGLEYLGLPKTVAVSTACRRANPYCLTEVALMRLGDPFWKGESSLEQLAPKLLAADLVIEATGSHQVAQVLSRLAAEAQVPMISAWMTDGFYGGEVVRIGPGTMCWTCFATAHRGGEILRAEAGPGSEVVVQGCAHPTTIGAGFDALEIAANATRLAVQTLSPDGGYPDSDFDHLAASFRRGSGDDFPRLATESLPPREECQQCQSAAGALVAH